ncbi:Fe-S cluster assembly ATP-binding protein [Glaciecola punicea ACAM 611]|jgi:Fe-S cluster assembly ATP-binding protein|uniref:Fe-S cluster assembly ATP-binding protein n=1 Tax=Glaciecola punicea ACAM 611 TaxID=1121923 RepID=H5TCI5_9ALTE|nr:Fe-S cluster assembly ATPase SufC [Glaciecola punicea]OFA31891.1 Fe-S cluster assembly ATPase SufC [Glaciecola punicea]GAB56012.1 Fe-S cluster assembly ATP-binding protein [Glaciecola punicea ACAM 611]
MLKINNLHASVEDKVILTGLNLEVKPGEVHAIMGPNGAGKSTLGYVLSGRDGYEVQQGDVSFKGEDLFEMDIEERASNGLFLAFQYPVEIPGVSNMEFMKESVNATREQRGEERLSATEFLKKAKEACNQVQLPLDFLKRGVNEGFSGGEKKRNEIMQMILLQPSLCILDESDSGLDVDALQVVANGVNSQRDSTRSFIIITHYQRLLDYIKPDFVHILADGKIVKTGDASLALRIEKEGYAFLGKEYEGASA